MIISSGNTVVPMKKRDLEPWEKDECSALKAAFDSYNRGRDRRDRLTQERAALELGMNQGSFSNYLNGRLAINAEFAAGVARLIGIPVSAFSPRLAEEIDTMAKVTGKEEPGANGAPSADDYALIPQYTAIAECGGGYLNDHAEVKGGLAFRRDWLAKLRVRPENLRVIYAHGDSMEPYIFEGDVVLFDCSDIEPRDRQVYAIRRPDGSISIKRAIQQLSGAWLIRSDNQFKYPDEPVSESALHSIPILGRVIWRGGGIS